MTASSNGFYIDDTPADLDVFIYTDVNLNDYEPVWFQSSNTTIKVLWSFIDMQSMVKVQPPQGRIQGFKKGEAHCKRGVHPRNVW